MSVAFIKYKCSKIILLLIQIWIELLPQVQTYIKTWLCNHYIISYTSMKTILWISISLTGYQGMGRFELNIVVEQVSLFHHIQPVLVSNLGLQNYTMTASFYIFSNSLFTNHHLIWCYINQTIESVTKFNKLKFLCNISILLVKPVPAPKYLAYPYLQRFPIPNFSLHIWILKYEKLYY